MASDCFQQVEVTLGCYLLFEGLHGKQSACQAGSSLGMPVTGLDCANCYSCLRSWPGSGACEGLAQSPHFDRISQWSARTVQSNISVVSGSYFYIAE